MKPVPLLQIINLKSRRKGRALPLWVQTQTPLWVQTQTPEMFSPPTSGWVSSALSLISMVGIYYKREEIKKNRSHQKASKDTSTFACWCLTASCATSKKGHLPDGLKKIFNWTFSVVDIYNNNAGEFNVRTFLFDVFASVGAGVVLNAFYETMIPPPSPQISSGANMSNICNCYECSSYINLSDYWRCVCDEVSEKN